MFEGFSFDSPSRRSTGATTASTNDVTTATPPTSVSPMSSRSASPIGGTRRTRPALPPLSVAELSNQLGEHTFLSRTHRPSYLGNLPTPPGDDEVFFSHRPSVTSNGPALPSIEPIPDSVRSQRQKHTQLQCESSHLQSLAALVAEMVSNGNQCCIYPTTSNPTSSPKSDRSPLSSRSSSMTPSSDDSDVDGQRSRRRRSVSIAERWRVRKEPRSAYRSTSGRSSPTSGMVRLARSSRKRLQEMGKIDESR
ncbi:MAG: hypothetical protein M1812_003648 [Candelaria pacifica]|nr:MAG: hypothetical protein M1812_003648 [Candelaria pacifica]